MRKTVAGLDYGVHDEKFAAGIHALPAGFEQPDAQIVLPVVNDVLHEVGIRTRGNRAEHVARSKSASFHHRLQRAVRSALNHVRHLIERASQMRVFLEDGSQQKSVATGYVHDGVNLSEIVSLGHGRAINHGELGHGVVENFPLHRVLL